MRFLESGLTIVAWWKGWGARALLPAVIGFDAAFLLGLSGGTYIDESRSGHDERPLR